MYHCGLRSRAQYCWVGQLQNQTMWLPVTAPSDTGGFSRVTLSTLGARPFGLWLVAWRLFFLHVETVVAAALCLLASPTTAGGPPLISSWWFEAGTAEQPFSVRLHFVAVLAEWLLLVVVGASLVVRLFSTFVLSRLEASFPTTAPWCSQSVRHRGVTDAKEEGTAASRYEDEEQRNVKCGRRSDKWTYIKCWQYKRFRKTNIINTRLPRRHNCTYQITHSAVLMLKWELSSCNNFRTFRASNALHEKPQLI